MPNGSETTTGVPLPARITVFRGPRGPGGSLDPFSKQLIQARRRSTAEEKIKRKAVSVGGNSVQPTGSLEAVADGYYRDYSIGRIYYRPAHEPFHVYGSIGVKYSELGGPNSWLGWPISDEMVFAQGGRATIFENGTIYWWADTGAIELGDVSVRYKGLICFGETDWDQGSDADEPYLILGVVPVDTQVPAALRTKVYEGVDGGEPQNDVIELFRGLPYGLSLTVVLMENDFGDPEKYRKQVEQGVARAGDALAYIARQIPLFGPLIAEGVEWALSEFGTDIAEAVNDTLDTDDDHLGTVSMVITAKDMVTMTRAQLTSEKGIAYHIGTPIISGEGASYRAYFDVNAA